jgi:hypothetical protein
MRSRSPLLSTFTSSIFLLSLACNAADPAGGSGGGGASTAVGGRAGNDGNVNSGGTSGRGEGGNSAGGSGAGGQSSAGGASGSGGVTAGQTSGGASGGGSGGMSGAAGGTLGMNDAGGDIREAGVESGVPASADTWANFAQAFMGKYCVSCHNDDRAGDAARDYHMLSIVVREKVDIACGTAKSQAERTKRACPANAPRANQFPAGNGPKPTDDERDRLLRWIDAGTP